MGWGCTWGSYRLRGDISTAKLVDVLNYKFLYIHDELVQVVILCVFT